MKNAIIRTSHKVKWFPVCIFLVISKWNTRKLYYQSEVHCYFTNHVGFKNLIYDVDDNDNDNDADNNNNKDEDNHLKRLNGLQ